MSRKCIGLILISLAAVVFICWFVKETNKQAVINQRKQQQERLVEAKLQRMIEASRVEREKKNKIILDKFKPTWDKYKAYFVEVPEYTLKTKYLMESYISKGLLKDFYIKKFDSRMDSSSSSYISGKFTGATALTFGNIEGDIKGGGKSETKELVRFMWSVDGKYYQVSSISVDKVIFMEDKKYATPRVSFVYYMKPMDNRPLAKITDYVERVIIKVNKI